MTIWAPTWADYLATMAWLSRRAGRTGIGRGVGLRLTKGGRA